MTQHMYKGLLTTLLLLLCHSALAAEVVYVRDELRLGVRPAPSSKERSIAVVTTGDKLTVLDKKDNFIRVRTEKGTEGWVSDKYVSNELPARELLAALQRKHEAVKGETETLRAELAQSQQSEEEGRAKLSALEQENASLKQQLATTQGELKEEQQAEGNSWMVMAALFLALFAAGFFLGVRWDKRRVAERIGGLEI